MGGKPKEVVRKPVQSERLEISLAERIEKRSEQIQVLLEDLETKRVATGSNDESMAELNCIYVRGSVGSESYFTETMTIGDWKKKIEHELESPLGVHTSDEKDSTRLDLFDEDIHYDSWTILTPTELANRAQYKEGKERAGVENEDIDSERAALIEAGIDPRVFGENNEITPSMILAAAERIQEFRNARPSTLA